MDVKKGETVFYKSSIQEIKQQLSLFVNRQIEPTISDSFNVAIVLYAWADLRVDLIIFHNDGQISFKRAVRHISTSDPGFCCWVKDYELAYIGEQNDNRS